MKLKELRVRGFRDKEKKDWGLKWKEESRVVGVYKERYGKRERRREKEEERRKEIRESRRLRTL